MASCWVIGGSSVYREALGSKDTDRVFVTEILKDFQCDTFFPELGPGWAVEVGMALGTKLKWLDCTVQECTELVPAGVQEEAGVTFQYKVYKRQAGT